MLMTREAQTLDSFEKDGIDRTKQYQYASDGYANETKAVGLMDDIFFVEINIGELYLLPLEN